MKKKFSSIVFLCFLFLTNTIQSQSYVVRLNSHLDSSITYVYNITINSNNTASITRSSSIALPSDRLGMQIIGSGYIFNPTTKILSLPNSNNGNQWWGVDNNYNGSVGIINGGTVEATCPCSRKKKGECDVSMAPDGCLTCVGGDCKCGGVVTEDIPSTGTNMYSIVINASFVSLIIL